MNKLVLCTVGLLDEKFHIVFENGNELLCKENLNFLYSNIEVNSELFNESKKDVCSDCLKRLEEIENNKNKGNLNV